MKRLLIIVLLFTSIFLGSSLSTVKALNIQTGDVIDGYEYHIVEDSTADVSRMRVPYIPDAKGEYSDSTYDSCEGKTGSSLIQSLKSLTKVSVKTSYDWSRFEFCDEDPNNTNNIWTIYGSTSLPKNAHVSGSKADCYNKEHTYPQSKLSGSQKSDTHHIYADDWKTNGKRSNHRYNDVANTSGNKVLDSAGKLTANFSDGSYFEPMDAVKGQVARATLYLYIMYDLSITGNFKSRELCLKWNNEYPVTSWEIYRNNKVAQVQGNRNPFVDHPEYGNMIFGLPSETTIDQEAVDAVISTIDLLPTTITLNDEDAVNAAKASYNDLTSQEQRAVSNSTKLFDAIDTLNVLKIAATPVSDIFKDYQTTTGLTLNYTKSTEKGPEQTVSEKIDLSSGDNYSEVVDANSVLSSIEEEISTYYNSFDISGIKLGSSSKPGSILFVLNSGIASNVINVVLSPWTSGGTSSGSPSKSDFTIEAVYLDGTKKEKSVSILEETTVSLDLESKELRGIRISTTSDGKRGFVREINFDTSGLAKINYSYSKATFNFTALLPKSDKFSDSTVTYGLLVSTDTLDLTNVTASNVTSLSGATNYNLTLKSNTSSFELNKSIEAKDFDTTYSGVFYLIKDGEITFMNKTTYSVKTICEAYLTQSTELQLNILQKQIALDLTTLDEIA